MTSRPLVPPADPRFAGVWRLQSFARHLPGGALLGYPLGEDADGVLQYAASGYMTAQLMRRGRALYDAEEATGGPAEARAAAAAGFVSYAGPYVVDPVSRSVTHQVELSLYPGWVGRTLLRHYELDGDHLVLVTPSFTVQGQAQYARLAWTRIG
jgi:hypothetical protein